MRMIKMKDYEKRRIEATINKEGICHRCGEDLLFSKSFVVGHGSIDINKTTTDQVVWKSDYDEEIICYECHEELKEFMNERRIRI